MRASRPPARRTVLALAVALAAGAVGAGQPAAGAGQPAAGAEPPTANSSRAAEPSTATSGPAAEPAATPYPWRSRIEWARSYARRRAGRVSFAAIDEDGVVRSPGDAAGQAAVVLDAIEAALERAGARMDQVVQTRMYVTDVSRAEEIGRAHAERFGASAPVTAMVQVAGLLDPRMLVEIEAVAYVGEAAP